MISFSSIFFSGFLMALIRSFEPYYYFEMRRFFWELFGFVIDEVLDWVSFCADTFDSVPFAVGEVSVADLDGSVWPDSVVEFASLENEVSVVTSLSDWTVDAEHTGVGS